MKTTLSNKRWFCGSKLNYGISQDDALSQQGNESLSSEHDIAYTMDDIEENIAREQLKSHIKKLFKNPAFLQDRELRIITYRFGLDGKGVRTFREIGEIFKVSKERIRQIEAKALRKLRHPSRLMTLMQPIELLWFYRSYICRDNRRLDYITSGWRGFEIKTFTKWNT